ncbi:MAG: DMT family transporter [Clostridia bacterium]|nr:DMT family transporter [Clostridia bacterium]
MTKKEFRIVLLSITLCWSSSYLFIKEIPEEVSAYAYLTLTSGVAALILSVAFRKLFRLMDRAALLRGVILGALITGNILFEKMGLDILPASTVSALAALNIVIVPLILIFRKQFPSRNNVAGIAIILVGLYLSGKFSAEGGGLLGIVWTLVSCAMMSMYTVLAADYTRKSDPLLLTVLQLWFTAAVGMVLWLVTDIGSFSRINWSAETLSYIMIIAFFSKAYAYVMLMYTEKYADAISVTVIAATEPIVTLGLAVLIPSTLSSAEIFTFRSLMGALIIAAGAVVAGTDFLSRDKGKAKDALAGDVQTTTASLPASPSPMTLKALPKGKIILASLGVLACYVILGASIHVMEFAGGLSGIRPQNAIPTPAGILAGPVGAMVCALGNFIADLFWLPVYGNTVLLGVVANFLAAFIPWKVWRSLSGRMPDAHSFKNIHIFIWAAFLGDITCAWVLSFGLQIFFPDRFEPLMIGAFWNNFIFTVALGLPLFIVITSGERKKSLLDSFWTLSDTLIRKKVQPIRLSLPQRIKPIWLLAADSVLLLALFFAEIGGLLWKNSLPVRILCVVAAVCVVLTCFLPRKEAEKNEKKAA